MPEEAAAEGKPELQFPEKAEEPGEPSERAVTASVEERSDGAPSSQQLSSRPASSLDQQEDRPRPVFSASLEEPGASGTTGTAGAKKKKKKKVKKKKMADEALDQSSIIVD